MTFAPEKKAAAVSETEQKKGLEVKKTAESSEEKKTKLESMRAELQNEFDDADEQLTDVENQLAALGEDAPAEKRKALEEELEMIQSTMDSIEQDLAGLSNPEEPVMSVDNAVVETVTEVSPSENKMVEATQELSLEEKKFLALKEKFSTNVEAILEEMPDLNQEASIDTANKKVSGVLDKLNDLMLSVKPGPKGNLVLKEVFGKIGTSVIEFGKQLKRKAGEKDIYNLESITELARFGRQMDDHEPEAGAECAKFVLDEYVKKFSGKKPEEIRKGTFYEKDNGALYAAFETVVKRLGRGEQLPEGLRTTVKELLPILEASDKTEPEKAGYAEASRFLTPEFIARHQSFSEDRKTFTEDKKKFVERVMQALQQL